ncbi:hypothetical protein FCZ44_30350, partial [Escherichia coli]|nr:hypothetical protein [Escherichia coli]
MTAQQRCSLSCNQCTALYRAMGNTGHKSLYIDLCNCLILICSIQHQMKVNLWTKNSYRLWLTN